MKTLNYTIRLLTSIILLGTSSAIAAERNQERSNIGQNTLPMGAKGVAWYTTWETALEEAQRSNRPIFFMTGATQCGKISGAFCPGYTKSDNQLFTQPRFIELSERFVCVRLASLECQSTVDRIESLGGKFGNTTFVIYAPDGATKLTKVGKSPRMVFNNRTPYTELEKIADQYTANESAEPPALQDFKSLKQALLTSSADQRLLIYSVGSSVLRDSDMTTLRKVAGDSAVRGRFHFDQIDAIDSAWQDELSGVTTEAGHYLVRPGKFGLEGEVLAHLPLGVDIDTFKASLLSANERYAQSEERKVHKEHIESGQAAGIKFENHWIKNMRDKRAVRRGGVPSDS